MKGDGSIDNDRVSCRGATLKSRPSPSSTPAAGGAGGAGGCFERAVLQW